MGGLVYFRGKFKELVYFVDVIFEGVIFSWLVSPNIYYQSTFGFVINNNKNIHYPTRAFYHMTVINKTIQDTYIYENVNAMNYK